MAVVPEQAMPVDNTTRAASAETLIRTMVKRPEAKANFIQASAMAVESGARGNKLTPELLGRYSATAMQYTKLSGEWSDRYNGIHRIQATQRVLDSFYDSIGRRGELTVDILAQLYDQLKINEPMCDGNSRATILAVTHALAERGYPPPDFSRTGHERWTKLQEQYRDDRHRASVEFLRECVGPIPLE